MLPLSKQEHQAGFIGQKRISTHRPLEVWLFFLAAFFFLETAFSQAPPGPSSGTGTLIYAQHSPLGPQICIEIGDASPKRFVYSYDPKAIVVTDANGKRIDTSGIAGWEVTFTAVRDKQASFAYPQMQVTNVTLLRRAQFLRGNTIPEEPSGPNFVVVSGDGTVDEVHVELGDNLAHITVIDRQSVNPYNTFEFDRNLVLVDADGKNVDISVPHRDMKVNYTVIVEKEHRERPAKLTKLVLTEFRAGAGRASPSPGVSATSPDPTL